MIVAAIHHFLLSHSDMQNGDGHVVEKMKKEKTRKSEKEEWNKQKEDKNKILRMKKIGSNIIE